jgi:hypothetical protein
MVNPATQTLQDITNLVIMIGVVTLVTISWKASRANTKRELKLDAIHEDVKLTQTNHLEHVAQDLAAVGKAQQEQRLEVLREVRDSNAKVIEAVRDSGDRIVQAIITTLKN